MPICNDCIQPCACVLSDLLTYGLTGVEENEFGLLRVDGKGTPGDPFTISFPNSEEYRPLAGELLYSPYSLSSGTAAEPPTALVVYQSPDTVYVVVPTATNTNIVQRTQSVLFVGASVEFTANATGERYIAIQQLGGIATREISRAHSDGTSAQNHRLSTTAIAFHPDTTANIQPISSPKYTIFKILIYQNSGAAMNINLVKFWSVSL